jgi:hypothetical protein
MSRDGANRVWNRLLSIVFFASVAPVLAHHSRANFDLDELIELDGVITVVNWHNPHAYFEIEVESSNGAIQTWLVESHSLTGLGRLGWLQDSLQVGDRVFMIGNPDRSASKHFMLLDHVIRDDGSKLFSFQIPEGEQVAGALDDRPTAPSTDYSGTWTRVATMQENLIGGAEPPADWPLTAVGRAQVAAFDSGNDPSFRCVQRAVPRLILEPYRIHWARSADRILMRKENSGIERTIHLGVRSHPDNMQSNAIGHSVGWFEVDGTLVIDTVAFEPTPWGSATGIDSSNQKHVVERYKLTDDGYGMTVSYTLEDPVYLTAPVTVTGQYRKVADHELRAFQCDPDTAVRHLTIE